MRSFLGGLLQLDAVQIPRQVRVPVEDEGGGVRVRAHVLKENPVANFSPGHHRRVLLANLVEAVTCGTEDCRGQQDFILLGDVRSEFLGVRVVMIIHNVVK